MSNKEHDFDIALEKHFKEQRIQSLHSLSTHTNASLVFGVLREIEYFAQQEKEAEQQVDDVPYWHWSMS